MIEKRLREKIAQLIERSNASADAAGKTKQGLAEGKAWVAEALNVVQLALPDMFHPYRRQIEMLEFNVGQRVLTIAATLRSMLDDVDAGLVSTLANSIRAETFDNFLDHAAAYQRDNRKNEAGVIAGVVFEDTVRKIYADKVDKVARPDLAQVIIALTKSNVITKEQAKQTEVATHVRNRASHADWGKFSMDGVEDTIKITKALIKAHLK